ncbi:MAG: hypothetical protein JNL96_25590 [Planctomycetaceae bacterium]|nr:hypothetical protein [Planctomycetaceae bacterium]
MPFARSYLTGAGTSIADQVNQHLIAAFDSPACYAATSANEGLFEDWYQVGCATAAPSEFEKIAVLLAIRTAPDSELKPADWLQLNGASIYAQILNPREGTLIRNNFAKILLLVWASPAEFRRGAQPFLLRCRASTQNPGKASQNRGSNVADNPIEGFLAVLFDASQLNSKQTRRQASPSFDDAQSGRQFEYFDFEFPATRRRASDVDGEIDPPDQFLLEVEEVVPPASLYRQVSDAEERVTPELLWEPNSLAFAPSRKSARLERLPGYRVSEREATTIRKTLEDEFGVDLRFAKALPTAEANEAVLGLRLARHPLHETFLTNVDDEAKDEFYKEIERGKLTADLDMLSETGYAPNKPSKPEHRVQKVFTMSWKELTKTWFAAARRMEEK